MLSDKFEVEEFSKNKTVSNFIGKLLSSVVRKIGEKMYDELYNEYNSQINPNLPLAMLRFKLRLNLSCKARTRKWKK